jgi:single-strand DNA-binding protein
MNDSNHAAAPSNVAVIRGALQSEPHVRDLPGGGIVVQFDVTTRVCREGRETNVSVPIAWNDPTSPQLGVLIAGAEVVVVGTVRRRFFRVGGATQSRTEGRGRCGDSGTPSPACLRRTPRGGGSAARPGSVTDAPRLPHTRLRTHQDRCATSG